MTSNDASWEDPRPMMDAMQDSLVAEDVAEAVQTRKRTPDRQADPVPTTVVAPL